jgi:hypothetical protein
MWGKGELSEDENEAIYRGASDRYKPKMTGWQGCKINTKTQTVETVENAPTDPILNPISIGGICKVQVQKKKSILYQLLTKSTILYFIHSLI